MSASGLLDKLLACAVHWQMLLNFEWRLTDPAKPSKPADLQSTRPPYKILKNPMLVSTVCIAMEGAICIARNQSLAAPVSCFITTAGQRT
jgi:hypothetical protein